MLLDLAADSRQTVPADLPDYIRQHDKLPTHVNLDAPVPGLYRDSIILLEQLRTIDKSRLRGKVGSLGEGQMCKLDHALEVSVGLLPLYNTI